MSQNTIHQVAFKTNVASAKDIQQRDCARAKHHLAGHQPYGPKKGHPKAGCGSSSSTTSSIPVNNNGVTYIASVGVGSPATTYDLLIDTGSSNTWIKSDGDKQYNPTSTSKDTRKPFQIQYGLGSCSGTEYTDQVTLGPDLVIKDQSIGVADKADQMNGIDGILGIGPVDLTQSTMSPADSDPNGIATVTDNLLKQGTISTECIGICYEPTTTAEGPTGCLSFGGPDPSKYTPDKLNYVPITKTSPACNYWGIEQSICYGSEEIMAVECGIMDIDSVMKAYCAKTGAVPDQTTGLLTVTEDQYNNMESMFFCIGDVKYELTKNAQIWPRSMNSTLGASDDKICLIFADMGDIQAGDGLCFINGFTFLQRYYSVYDTTNRQVGIAPTQYTMATTN